MESTKVRKILNKLLRKSTHTRVYGAHEHKKRDKNRPLAVVINTDPIYKPGQHWVCMYFTREKGYFFDSFGRHPKEIHRCWEKYMNRHASNAWTYNTIPVQPRSSPNCAYYCIKVLKGLDKGEKFYNILQNLDERRIRHYKQALKKFMQEQE